MRRLGPGATSACQTEGGTWWQRVPDSEHRAKVGLCAPPDCVCDKTYGALLQPRPVASTPAPVSPPVRSCVSPSARPQWLLPTRSPAARRPTPAECRASAPLPTPLCDLGPSRHPLAVPLRAVLAARAAAPAVSLSPLVWPPGRGGREQPEEEPQPGGGGRSPWRTVKEAARRKCATIMTVSGRGACSGAAGRARRGIEGGSPRGHRQGLPSARPPTRGRPPSLLSGPPLGHAYVWGALPRTGLRGTPVGSPGLTAQSRPPGAPPRVPVPSPARPVPPSRPRSVGAALPASPGTPGARVELRRSYCWPGAKFAERRCLAGVLRGLHPSPLFLQAPLSQGSDGRAALPR